MQLSSAYQYPLIFKQLWHTPRVQAPDQEIVYRDLKRFTYLQIKERIGRLASALSKAGVVPGDTSWTTRSLGGGAWAMAVAQAASVAINSACSSARVDAMRERFRQQRLRDAGHALQDDVTANDQCGEQPEHDRILTDHRLLDFAPDRRQRGDGISLLGA